jgi:hypothetical protein
MGRCELTLSNEREYVKKLLNHNSLRDIASDFIYISSANIADLSASRKLEWGKDIFIVLGSVNDI